MGIVSKPATKRSRKGHAAVYGPDHGHINAACCECERCLARRGRIVPADTVQIPLRIYQIERSDKAGQYRIGVDLAKGGDHYTVHSVRVK